MVHCPMCGAQLRSMTCACGYDRSRDYTAYPTFGPLPAGTGTGRAQRPRQVMAACPKCGKETLLQEQTRDYRYRAPCCPHCAERVLLDPTDRFDLHAEVFLMMLAARKVGGMYRCAQTCMSTFRYGDPELAGRLADALASVAADPAKHGLVLEQDLREAFGRDAARARRMLQEHEVGKVIFE